MRLLLSLCIFACFLSCLEACTAAGPKKPKKPTPKPTPRPATPPPRRKPIEEKYGREGKTREFAKKDITDVNKDAITDPADLDCDFSGDCCWANVAGDNRNYEASSGRPDMAVFRPNFETTNTPSGDFLSVAGNGAETAAFYSCKTACAKNQEITLRHWRTRGAEIQVCQDKMPPDPRGGTISKCKVLSDRTGPTSLSLDDNDEEHFIVILVTRFGPGGMALIDDITMDFDPCGEETTPFYEDTTIEPTEEPTEEETAEPTPPTDEEPTDETETETETGGGRDPNCERVQCSFEGRDTCGWKVKEVRNGRGPRNRDDWFHSEEGRYKNRVTGVVRAGEGESYGATYLLPGESAMMESPDLDLKKPRRIKFLAYQAAFNLVMKACIDNVNNCRDLDELGADQVARNWRPVQMDLPKGTKKLFIVAENQGRNQGAAGIDAMELLRDNGRDSAC